MKPPYLTVSGYAYMLGLSTAVAYVPLFWAILLVLLKTGAAPMYQLRYMWQRNGYLAPVLLIVLAALGYLETGSNSPPKIGESTSSSHHCDCLWSPKWVSSPHLWIWGPWWRKSFEHSEVMRWVM